MLSVAPLIGSRMVPVRIRVGFAVLLALVVAPVVPVETVVDPFSSNALLIIVQQILIGLSMGFILRLVFSALENAGQTIGMLMGLGFAQMVDPSNGTPVPVVSQFYTVIGTLLFLSIDGHLVFLRVVTESFELIPVASTGLGASSLWEVVRWASWMFAGAVLIALPAIAALLLVNIAFGVMTRAAPQLNIFAVGFPVTLLLGFVVIAFSLTNVAPQFINLLDGGFSLMRQLNEAEVGR